MKIILYIFLILIAACCPKDSKAITFHQYPYSSLTKSGAWSTVSWSGSRTGNIIQTSSAGQTVSLTATDTDFYLIYAQSEYYDAYVQVNVDGVNTKIINLRGAHNTNAQGVAQEKITVKPLAVGLSNSSHTILLTTLNSVQYKIDSIETKSGITIIDNSSILGVGDSITQKGGQLLDINGVVGTGGTYTGWFTQLAAYLTKTPIDIGEGSATTDQIIIQFYDYAKSASSISSIITFMAGMNDCISYTAESSTWISDRFNDSISVIQSISPSSTVEIAQVTNTEGAWSSFNSTITAWNAAVTSVANSNNLPLVLTANYPANGYTSDGVHPTYAGHQWIASKFETVSIPPTGNAVNGVNAPINANFK